MWRKQRSIPHLKHKNNFLIHLRVICKNKSTWRVSVTISAAYGCETLKQIRKLETTKENTDRFDYIKALYTCNIRCK